MNAILSPPIPRPASPPGTEEDQEQCFLIDDVSWDSYLAIGNALQDRPGLRLTYDQGRLELMSTSPRHEFYKKRLSRLLDVLAEELNQPTISAGNMTFQKQALARGIEADDCYWVQHEPQMRGKLEWDPEVDPPPDLAVEIEISRTVLSRLAIYAAFKIAEVWRFNGTMLQVLRLQPDGTYQQISESICFPQIPIDEITRFLSLDGSNDNLTVIREFRQWIKGRAHRRSGT
jgi:Uma2 family endonuclease